MYVHSLVRSSMNSLTHRKLGDRRVSRAPGEYLCFVPSLLSSCHVRNEVSRSFVSFLGAILRILRTLRSNPSAITDRIAKGSSHQPVPKPGRELAAVQRARACLQQSALAPLRWQDRRSMFLALVPHVHGWVRPAGWFFQASCRSLLSLGSTPDLVPERVFEGSFTQTAQVQLAPRGPEDRAASKARERNVSMQTYVQTLCKYVYERTCGHAQGGPQRSGIRGDWRHRMDGMEAREAREAKAGVEVVSSIASEDSP